jgi:hypothetical protein
MTLQLAVIEDREELLSGSPAQELAEKERQAVPFHVIINPEITFLGDGTADFYEGCLSLSGFSAVVPRGAGFASHIWMNMEKHNLSKLLNGTPGYSSTKLITCEGRCTSTEWRAARSLRSTTGAVSVKASWSGTSSKAYPVP